MDDEVVRSKIAKYISGEVKLEELVDSHRMSVPLQKRFKFEDTWITMNRRIGEAAMVGNVDEAAASTSTTNRLGEKKLWKPSAIQKKRRNAVAVQDTADRLMTNGCTWPTAEDWAITADEKIRYVPLLRPLRTLDGRDWGTRESPKAPAIGSPERLSITNASNYSDKSSHMINITPGLCDDYMVDSST